VPIQDGLPLRTRLEANPLIDEVMGTAIDLPHSVEPGPESGRPRDMMIARQSIVAGSLLLLVAACGSDDARTSADGDEQVAGIVTVLESPEHGPQMCALVAESLPPQCTGPDITNWDWSTVEAESASGTTWGEFWVQGVFDTEQNTFDVVGLARTPTARERKVFFDRRDPDPTTPCEPDEITGDGVSGDAPDVGRTAEVDGFGGAWFDDSTDTLNVVYVADRSVIEAAVRESYDGPLCLVEGTTTMAELEEVRAAIAPSTNAYATSIDVVDNTVEVHVYAYDSALAAELTERHGRSAVRLDALLRPLV